MKALTVVGIILMLLGGLAMTCAFTYSTSETISDGSVTTSTTREGSWPLPPMIGGVILVIGVGLTALGARRSSS